MGAFQHVFLHILLQLLQCSCCFAFFEVQLLQYNYCNATVSMQLLQWNCCSVKCSNTCSYVGTWMPVYTCYICKGLHSRDIFSGNFNYIDCLIVMLVALSCITYFFSDFEQLLWRGLSENLCCRISTGALCRKKYFKYFWCAELNLEDWNILMVCHGQCSVVISHAPGSHFTELHLNDAPSHAKHQRYNQQLYQ